ncbi:MAG: trypsin-like peptidase domain-containing protein [Salinivirgaceae bacterium]|nr:trypsin-like peptidase domain-containing protein [Salinivirgaceae bacterium]
MMKQLIIVFISLLLSVNCVLAQSEMLASSRLNLPALRSVSMLPSRKVLAKTDFDGLAADPNVFAVPIETDLNPCNSGEWESAEGVRVWRLALCSPNAFSLNATLSDFYIPADAELSIYGTDSSRQVTTLTAEQNADVLPLPPVEGDMLVFEYVEPLDAEFQGMFSIVQVAHDFKGVFAAADSVDAECHIGIDSDFGVDWQNEQRAVCQIIIGGTTLCTGTLLASADGSCEPYVLTARHCVHTQKMAETCVFYFKNDDALNVPAIVGATLVATKDNDDGFLDFSLLKLSERPDGLGVYYAGWDASGEVPSGAVCIHHPASGGKLISVDNDSLKVASYRNFDENSFFNVEEWDVGTTEIGSSGAPIFDSNHRVVGILAGGDADCAYPMNDYFQMFSICYDRYADESQQLKRWLNSNDTSVLRIDGRYPQPSVISEKKVGSTLSVYPNPAKNVVDISCDNQMITSVTIVDLQGRQMLRLNVGREPSVRVDVSELPLGIYVCRVTFENGESDNAMIIKE